MVNEKSMIYILEAIQTLLIQKHVITTFLCFLNHKLPQCQITTKPISKPEIIHNPGSKDQPQIAIQSAQEYP